MSLNIIVLAKQVPDTRNVGKDAMKEDGTINRAALPAIFNPEDLNALEQAIRLKEANPGSKITILIQNGNIYILSAEFEIVVDEATGRKLYWTEASGMGVFAQQKGNVFTFSFSFRSDKYTITATVSDDYKTFTYKYTKA